MKAFDRLKAEGFAFWFQIFSFLINCIKHEPKFKIYRQWFKKSKIIRKPYKVINANI